MPPSLRLRFPAAALHTATHHGAQYLRPLYRALYRSGPEARQLAVDTFAAVGGCAVLFWLCGAAGRGLTQRSAGGWLNLTRPDTTPPQLTTQLDTHRRYHPIASKMVEADLHMRGA